MGLLWACFCVGLPEPIERNHLIVLDWVRFPNSIQHNLMDYWVQLVSICSIKLDWFGNWTHTKFSVRFGLNAELNRTQSMAWVWLSSIFEHSIYYARYHGHSTLYPSLSGTSSGFFTKFSHQHLYLFYMEVLSPSPTPKWLMTSSVQWL